MHAEHNTSASARSRPAGVNCSAWERVLRALRPQQQRSSALASKSSLAICLTGQLRLFMVTMPALIKHLLAGLATHSRVDFFYVGPGDDSFAHGRPWLLQLPSLHSCYIYSPALLWTDKRGAPVYEEEASTSGK